MEIIQNRRKEDIGGGWFQCQSCNMFILLSRDFFRRANSAKIQEKNVNCISCDPINGFVFDKKTRGAIEPEITNYGEWS